jgi:hypothetical protein
MGHVSKWKKNGSERFERRRRRTEVIEESSELRNPQRNRVHKLAGLPVLLHSHGICRCCKKGHTHTRRTHRGTGTSVTFASCMDGGCRRSTRMACARIRAKRSLYPAREPQASWASLPSRRLCLLLLLPSCCPRKENCAQSLKLVAIDIRYPQCCGCLPGTSIHVVVSAGSQASHHDTTHDTPQVRFLPHPRGAPMWLGCKRRGAARCTSGPLVVSESVPSTMVACLGAHTSGS